MCHEPSSVTMKMVQVGYMRVPMCDRVVPMPVTVSPLRHRVVCMGVVPIIMRVGVLMLQDLMRVLVFVRFRKVQQHPQQHEQPTQCQECGARTLAQGERTDCPDEWREREHRAGPCCAKRALR